MQESCGSSQHGSDCVDCSQPYLTKGILKDTYTSDVLVPSVRL